MPTRLICCVSLPPTTVSSGPIYDFANEHEEFAIDAICALTDYYFQGIVGLQQEEEKAVVELWSQAAKLGSSDAHYQQGSVYDEMRDMKKARSHLRPRLWLWLDTKPQDTTLE